MNYYQQLAETIDQLQQQGKEVKITKLPSTFKLKRKTWL